MAVGFVRRAVAIVIAAFKIAILAVAGTMSAHIHNFIYKDYQTRP